MDRGGFDRGGFGLSASGLRLPASNSKRLDLGLRLGLPRSEVQGLTFDGLRAAVANYFFSFSSLGAGLGLAAGLAWGLGWLLGSGRASV